MEGEGESKAASIDGGVDGATEPAGTTVDSSADNIDTQSKPIENNDESVSIPESDSLNLNKQGEEVAPAEEILDPSSAEQSNTVSSQNVDSSEKSDADPTETSNAGVPTQVDPSSEHNTEAVTPAESAPCNFNEETIEEKPVSSDVNISTNNDYISKLSPFSNTNSECSEREIALEPLTAEESITAPESAPSGKESENTVESTGASLTAIDQASPVSGGAAGPSDEREDISDEELELDSIESVENEQPCNGAPSGPSEPPTNVELCVEKREPSTDSISVEGKDTGVLGNQLANDDTRGTPSSDDREIIDLKLEDAVGKSEDGSGEVDANRESKGPSEDLEAVSDDELPEASHPARTTQIPVNPVLIEGGEEVSSSEDDGPASPDSTYNAAHHPEISANISLNLDASEVSDGNVSSSDLTFRSGDKGNEDSSSGAPVASVLPGLAPLEAEPISDEEDMGHTDTPASPAGFEGGEAGEIKSPADLRSPVSDAEPGAGLLGEVEPISADENSDTDGELHSGDEDASSRPPQNGGVESNTNLEPIDSDEEGDIGVGLSHKRSPSSHLTAPATSAGPTIEKNDTEYMETISDEENLDMGGDSPDKHFSRRRSSSRPSERPVTGMSPMTKDSEIERRPVPPNFNEHQVELDYEENEGDDGEGKQEEPSAEPKIKEGGEEGELAEGAGSDKDEGELSDDDCEEGEIKEPGSKKPFVMPKCRFFMRGHCTWGISCRFLHPGVNDKGNYQMIEIPGFKPTGVRARIGVPGQWPEQPEEPIELPPPPMPDVPPVETAWERGLRIAKEQRKKASERKEQEPNFEDKRLNLSVDEERELNKENERMPKIIPKDPYYDQQAFEEDEYYKLPRDPWQTGHYENFEVRYNRENSFSPPYRDKPMMPPARYSRPYSPVDKFGRDRVERREPFRPEPPPAPHDYPSPVKRPDEWTDPWRRSKSPQTQAKRKARSRSRGRRAHRSVSDSSNSSRSSSGSSSASSRSSRSFSGSSGSSSRSRSPEPAPPGVDRHDRYVSPSRDQPRSAVSVRGPGSYNNYDSGFRRGGRGYDRRGGGGGGYNQRGGYRGGGGGRGGDHYYNNYGGGGGGGGYPDRDFRDRGRDDRTGRRGRSPPDRPLPYVRPRPKSASSHSSSSRSRSRSRGRGSSSHSRSSSGSSRSSSSSSSTGSADSEHLYRDLGSPSKNTRGPTAPKKKRTNSHKDRSGGKAPLPPGHPGSQKHPGPPSQPPVNLDRIPHPRDPKQSQPIPPPGRPESKYASRNAPQAPTKAKDPLKVVGQKSNIKLTLLPKQQQSSLGSRPNPLDSPPHPHPHKRRLSDRDSSPGPAPPAKRLALPVPQASSLRLATETAAKIQMRQGKGKSPPPAPAPQPSSSSISASSSNVPRAKAAVSPQKQPSSVKSRAMEPAVAKAAPKAPSASAPTAATTGTKGKKSMSSRREELLKQLKAVEDAIARKKSKLP